VSKTRENVKETRNWFVTSMVLLIVSLNIAVALFLDFSAANFPFFSIQAFFCISAVVLFSGLRFILWGWVHRRVNLSKSYALTAVFFPLIAFVSHLQGETISIAQWIGVSLIFAGVIYITTRVPNV